MTAYDSQAGVLYVANSALIGGGNRVLMDLILGLERSRFCPSLVMPFIGPLAEWADANNVSYHVLPSIGEGRLGLLRQAYAIRGALRAARASLVHAISPISYRAVGLAGLFTSVRRICHIQLPPGSGQLEWCFRFGPEAVITCYQAQADEVRNDLARVSPRARLVAIPNSVDVEGFSPGAPDPAFRFGADRVVLITGHLSEVKGYSTFLRAAAALRDRVGRVAFISLGGETLEPGAQTRYEAMARELGISDSVHFLGWRSDVAAVLRSADIVVLPSKLEGLPLSVLEAMSCARPVIATAVNGTPEAVIDGVTGLLVAPDDVEGLSSAILTLVNDPDRAARMGEEGRRVAVDRFSLRAYLRGIEALYDELLGFSRSVH